MSRRLHCFLLLQLATACARGQSIHQPDPSEQATALVQRFYRQVVVHETYGLRGVEWKIFDPYLSQKLRHTMAMTRACGRDWLRKDHSNPPQKSPLSMESGLLSGTADEVTSRRPIFVVERTEAMPDRSFLVHVGITQLWPAPEKPEIWEVAARVVMQEGHPVIDDVIYHYGGVQMSSDGSLSSILAVPGCVGPRWVGR